MVWCRVLQQRSSSVQSVLACLSPEFGMFPKALAGCFLWPWAQIISQEFSPRIFSDIGSLLTNTVLTPLGQDMKATGEKIVSAVAAFFGDEDRLTLTQTITDLSIDPIDRTRSWYLSSSQFYFRWLAAWWQTPAQWWSPLPTYVRPVVFFMHTKLPKKTKNVSSQKKHCLVLFYIVSLFRIHLILQMIPGSFQRHFWADRRQRHHGLGKRYHWQVGTECANSVERAQQNQKNLCFLSKEILHAIAVFHPMAGQSNCQQGDGSNWRNQWNPWEVHFGYQRNQGAWIRGVYLW